MIIETILFLTFVVAMGAIIVKAYEWRQDVLYGPYICPSSQATIDRWPTSPTQSGSAKVQPSMPQKLVALRWAGPGTRSTQPPAKAIAIAPRRLSCKFAKFTLIFVICTAMLSWFGFLSWGAYSVARWLWQLISRLSDEPSLAGLFN